MPETRTVKAEIPKRPLLCAQPEHPGAFCLVDKIVSTPHHTVRFGKTGPVSPKRSRHLSRSTSGQSVSGEICRYRLHETCRPISQPDTVGIHHGRSRAVAHGSHGLVCRCLEFRWPRSGQLTPRIRDSRIGVPDSCHRTSPRVVGFRGQPNHHGFSGSRPLSRLAAGVDRTGYVPCRRCPRPDRLGHDPSR